VHDQVVAEGVGGVLVAPDGFLAPLEERTWCSTAGDGRLVRFAVPLPAVLSRHHDRIVSAIRWRLPMIALGWPTATDEQPSSA